MNGRINIAIQVCNNGLLLTQFAGNMLSDSRLAVGKCRPDCQTIIMTKRQKIADLQFLLKLLNWQGMII